jgi:hypothetical protein
LPTNGADATVFLARRAWRARMQEFTGVKVFSTTLARDREVMGDTVNRWLAAHPELEVVSHEVRQSSDKEFHCLTITFFFREKARAEH